MKELKYKVIKTEKQYFEYCAILINLIELDSNNKKNRDEIELIEILIEKWDKDHTPEFENLDPVQLLKAIMYNAGLKSITLAADLSVQRSLISDILNYKKGFSKDLIRKLSVKFKLQQEVFNKPYKLKPIKKKPKKKIAA